LRHLERPAAGNRAGNLQALRLEVDILHSQAAQLSWAQAGVDHQRDRGSILVVQAALVDQQAEFLLGQRVRVRLTQRKKGAGVSQALDGKAVRLAPAQEPGEGRQI